MSRALSRRYVAERAVSAGGVVYRQTDGSLEIVVCGRMAAGIWGLPKGTPNPGESIEETALREVAEETGLQVEIDRKIGTVEYWFVSSHGGHRVHKRVHHFLMQSTGGRTEEHDHEYDTVMWMLVEQALGSLSYENEANIVRKAVAMLQEERA